MSEGFFTTKRAAEIVGCTVRQIQYWRKQEVVVPKVNPSGTGHSAYYSREDLTDLAIIHYLLQRGYSFQSAGQTLNQLRAIDPQYNSPNNNKRYLLKWDSENEILMIASFDSELLREDMQEGVMSATTLSFDLLQAEIEAKLGNQPRRRKTLRPVTSKRMSETETCQEYILPRLQEAGWEQGNCSIAKQQRFNDGRVFALGGKVKSRPPKIADYILYCHPHFPMAIVEAKANDKPADQGLEQAKAYADILGLKFAYSTNGSGIIEFDATNGQQTERTSFPTPLELWARYCQSEGLKLDHIEELLIDYDFQNDQKLRYYQEIAIRKTLQAIWKGQKRLLLTMAIGTGKPITAFYICWILWLSQWNLEGTTRRPKILYLADQEALIDNILVNNYAPFGDVLYKIQNGRIVKERDIYFATYQSISEKFSTKCLYEDFPNDFFDFIIIGECSYKYFSRDNLWRKILTYFASAVQLCFSTTLLPEECGDIYQYFGSPIYTYSSAQGMEDGFLSLYRIYRVSLTSKNIDLGMALRLKTQAIAKHLTNFMKKTDRFAKTLVFCVDPGHAQEMQRALIHLNADLVKNYPNYVCCVTDEDGVVGQAHLAQFQKRETATPVILTTSHSLMAGLDAPTLQNIVIARMIASPPEFHQMMGLGTGLCKEAGKWVLTILDYTGIATIDFLAPEFDGQPIWIEEEIIDDNGNIVEQKILYEEIEEELETDFLNPV